MKDYEVLADQIELSAEDIEKDVSEFMGSVRMLERFITSGRVGVRTGGLGLADGPFEFAFCVPDGFVVSVYPRDNGTYLEGLSSYEDGYNRFDEPMTFDQEHPFMATTIEAVFQEPEGLSEDEGRLRIRFVRVLNELVTEMITTTDMSEFEGFNLDVIEAPDQD